MNSRLNQVVRATLVTLTAALALQGCGSKEQETSAVSHPHFISFGPNVHGLTEKVKKPELRICLAGVAAGTEWETWEGNIQSVVLKWVDALRPVAQAELAKSVLVSDEKSNCDGYVKVQPGTWSNAQIGATPTVNMDSAGYFASYKVLLHEFGHAFALSDTYQGGQSGNCKPGQPQAVMCNTSFEDLQDDDVKGIQAVYQNAFPNG